MEEPPKRRYRIPEGLSELASYEIFWRDRFAFFETHGYRLRQRYRPDWIASWVKNDVDASFCEDYYCGTPKPVMDAKRMRDGVTVAIKRVQSDGNELKIVRFLTTPEKLLDPANHVVPIYDDFADDKDPKLHFIVMPLLRPFNNPPFYSVGEVVDFAQQILEGLVYIHSLNTAHRDCADVNIMMNGDPLYPEGFHPARRTRTPDVQRVAKVLRRRDVSNVKYYFVDFGISSRFRDDDNERLAIGRDGVDQDVPELKSKHVYDPFLVDVFIIGNLVKNEFVQKYENMSFLQPLVESMTDVDPTKRPTASAALERFTTIIKKHSGVSLRWRLRAPKESLRPRLLGDVGSIIWEAQYQAKHALSLVATLTTAKLKRKSA